MTLLPVSLAGAALFLWPFTGLRAPAEAAAFGLALACLLLLLTLETATRRLDSRRLALLASLAAIDSALRLAFVVGVAGFNPVFFLILCAGFAFGPTYGFLVGSSSLLVSAVATGGVGPWVPYQMFAAGWVGALAGLAGLGWDGSPSRVRLALLALAGLVLGFAFGAVMDIQVWVTGFRGSPGLGWEPGLPAGQALANFGRFYVATSLLYDSFRAGGNALLVVLLGAPVLAAMGRFRRRFSYALVPPATSLTTE